MSQRLSIRRGISSRLSAYRNPVYLLYVILAIPIFLIAAAIASSGTSPVEESILRTFNSMNQYFYIFFGTVGLFGTIGMATIISIIVMSRKRYSAGLKILLASWAAYLTAYELKHFDIRPRPYEFLQNITVREDSIGTYGFPSGHAAVATVLALTAYQFLPKRWHKPVTVVAVLVCISRLYIGVHLPMDLVGGFAIGLLFGGLFNFIIGTNKNSAIDPAIVKQKLQKIALNAKTVKLASVDARGSVPYLVELTDGRKVFVKVVGRDNNIADWLFKSWRKIIYRRLEDETPFLNAKRQLEHEAYVSFLAARAGVRTPDVLGIFEVEHDRWGHVQEAIDGKSLDKVDLAQITDKVLLEVWKQVALLHKNNIVHRDLRCANVFLDKSGTPWMIDFGFSEAGLSDESKNRDRAELLASSATLVGAKRAVKVAMKVLTKDELESTSKYLSYAVLSSASAKAIKNQKGLLPELHQTIIDLAHIKKQKPLSIQRVHIKNVLMILAVVLGYVFFMKQRDSLGNALDAILDGNPTYIAIGVVCSFMTYAMAALSYKSLLLYPIVCTRMLLIQVASSFASKLVPAGAGGLALNARFLTKSGHSLIQAGSIAGINNIMGLVGHMSVLLMLVLFGGTSIKEAFSFNIAVPIWVLPLVAGIVIVAVIVFIIKQTYRQKIVKTLISLKNTLAEYREHPLRLFGSYASSILTTLSYTGALYFSALALGADITLLQTIVVFTVGVAAASVTPTPGGIGGAEAGLAAALTGTGLTPELAISVTLLYRFLTYWLPILPGFIAFQYSTKKEYI